MTAGKPSARERSGSRTRLAPRRATLVLSVVVAIGACDAGKPAPRLATFTPDPDVVRIETDRDLALTLTAAPRPLVAMVTRKSGVTDTVRITDARAEDTAIVRVIDDALVPNGVGRSALVFVVSGHRITANAQVTDRVADEPVVLSPGEVRAWELVPGWYEIAVRRADTTANSPLQLAAPLTCVPHSLDPDAINCRVPEATRIVLKHSGRGGRASAHIAILRVK